LATTPISSYSVRIDRLIGAWLCRPTLFMATRFAFVTLLTSDSYLPGALALAAAIKDVHPSPPTPPQSDFQTVCLVTPETVDVTSIKLLRRAFNIVVGVETIGQEDEKGLQLLGESLFVI
jgi:glycogenin